MISKLFSKIRKEEHEKALHHEAKMLVTENERTNLQKTIMETTKRPIGRPNLQLQLTFNSCDKQIK